MRHAARVFSFLFILAVVTALMNEFVVLPIVTATFHLFGG